MLVKTIEFGEIELEIYVDRFSAVDSFINAAYSVDLDRELTDDEIDGLNLRGLVEEYAYNNGSLNHN